MGYILLRYQANPLTCNMRLSSDAFALGEGAAKEWDKRKRQLSDFCVAREENCWKIGILQIAVM